MQFKTMNLHLLLDRRRESRPVFTALALSILVSAGWNLTVRAESTSAVASSDGVQVLTLDDVQDVGIILRNIREQSINIYEEAARVSVPLNGNPELPEFHSIPYKIDESKVLPARPEWLVYNLGTMEPLIKQLAHQVTDIQKGMKHLVVPELLKETVDPLWETWSTHIERMNGHLSELLPLIDDAPHNNERIRKVAVAIFDDAKELEKIREAIFRAVQKSSREHPDAKILISPP